MPPIHKHYRYLLLHTCNSLFWKWETWFPFSLILFDQSPSYVIQYCIPVSSFLSGFDITHEAASPQGHLSHLVSVPTPCTRSPPCFVVRTPSSACLDLSILFWSPLPHMDALFTPFASDTLLGSPPLWSAHSHPVPSLTLHQVPTQEDPAYSWMLILGRLSKSTPSSTSIGIPSVQKSCFPCSPCSGSSTVPGNPLM